MLPLAKEAILNFFRKPVTVCYPYVKVTPAQGFRGRHSFDQKLCIACRACELSCPAKCLVFDMKKKVPVIDLSVCIFCGECSEHCPKKCLNLTQEFELASDSKPSLVFAPQK